jgi:uncharacterized cofD-like protein
MKNIVTIGGGTGQPITLAALRCLSDLDITAIVSTMDDGGSTGRLRKELDILPPADVYRCCLALSPYQDAYESLFKKRFIKNDQLKGHTVGNMLFSMLNKYSGDYYEAIKAFAEILEACGQVVPVTLESADLVAEYSDGKIVRGENAIEEEKIYDKDLKIKKLYIDPGISAFAEAIRVIRSADYIILGPGDLYTSVLANIVVNGVAEAIKDSPAKLVYITNIMTKAGQTHGMFVSDLVREIEKYCLKPLDYIIINSGEVPTDILNKYRAVGENIIQDDLISDRRCKRQDIISVEEIKKIEGDKLFRSYIRHDRDKLAEVLNKII